MVAPIWILVLLLGIPALIWGVFAAPGATMNILGLLTFFGGLMKETSQADKAQVAFGETMLVFSGLCFVAAAIRGRTDYTVTEKIAATHDNTT